MVVRREIRFFSNYGDFLLIEVQLKEVRHYRQVLKFPYVLNLHLVLIKVKAVPFPLVF